MTDPRITGITTTLVGIVTVLAAAALIGIATGVV